MKTSDHLSWRTSDIEEENLPEKPYTREKIHRFVEAYYPFVTAIARRYCNRFSKYSGYEDAEDLTQDVMMCFEKILENYEANNRESAFGAFLRGCVRNMALEMTRKDAPRNTKRRRLDSRITYYLGRIKKQDLSPQEKIAITIHVSRQSITWHDLKLLEMIYDILKRPENRRKYLSDEDICHELHLQGKETDLEQIENIMARFEKTEKDDSALDEIEYSVIEIQNEIKRALHEFQEHDPLSASLTFAHYHEGKTDHEIAAQENQPLNRILYLRRNALKKLADFVAI